MTSDSQSWAELENSLLLLSSWQRLTGHGSSPLLSVNSSSMPTEVQQAHDFLMRLSSDHLEPARVRESAASELDKVIRSLGHRERRILHERTLAPKPWTLEALALEFGVTRERVRQLEEKALKHLSDSSIMEACREVARSALEGEAVVAPLDQVLLQLPSLQEEVPSLGSPLWLSLSKLELGFEVVDGWWCTPGFQTAKERTVREVHQRADLNGIVALRDHPAWQSYGWGEAWLQRCGLQMVEGQVLLGSTSIGARAAAVLRNNNAPLTTEELAQRIGTERSTRSIKNVLASDSQFTRVDRDSWSLSSWGMDAYSSIRKQIEIEVLQSGGSIRLARLIDNIAASFSVSPRSVAHYAASFPFVTVDGMVEFASSFTEAPRRDPHLTRRLFRLPAAWLLRIEVNSEHLRGSGFSIPTALANVLELRPGAEVSLPSRLGSQKVTWKGTQPICGSIKRFTDDLGLIAGGTCFAVFDDAGLFEVQAVSIPRDLGLERASALAGTVLLGTPVTLADLARAIGLSHDYSLGGVRDRLLARGDYDLVECFGGSGFEGVQGANSADPTEHARDSRTTSRSVPRDTPT